jgi:hypothetical protein
MVSLLGFPVHQNPLLRKRNGVRYRAVLAPAKSSKVHDDSNAAYASPQIGRPEDGAETHAVINLCPGALVSACERTPAAQRCSNQVNCRAAL